MERVRIYLLGASGKMGKALQELINASHRYTHVASMEEADVLIDFSSPVATIKHLHIAKELSKPLVIGTTGLTDEIWHVIHQTAQDIPLMHSPNFSLGMALCIQSIQAMSHCLFGHCYIEITETHHLLKKDAPSGTALSMAQAIEQGEILLTCPPHRNKNQILIHSIRSGDVVGEHSIVFSGEHEQIEIRHTAHSRTAFAEGALQAAQFLIEQPPGFYSIKDIFLI